MSEPDREPSGLHLDSPETAPDLLGREELTRILARGLIRSRPNESLITAVYGPWGSGKSWIKHRVLKEIAKVSDKISVVEFAPWQIRGVEELTVQFFAQVHEKLAPSDASNGNMAKRGAMWMSLARLSGAGSAALKVVGGAAALNGNWQIFAPALMAAAGVSENFATLLQKSAEDLAKHNSKPSPATAEEARKQLADIFSDPSSPSLLVIIDDLDRLTSDEIQTLIRLIKANANFPGLNYLLFCDHEQLAQALDPIASRRGKEFLEKIVQNPIRLPRPDRDSILRQLANGLEKIAQRTDYPSVEQGPRLGIYFQNFLHIGLRNLRSVYRLLEAIDFSATALTRNGKLEVDLIDLLAVDYLRLHVPALVDWLQDFRPSFHVFLGVRSLFNDGENQPFAETLPKSEVGGFGFVNCYTAIRTLFPKIAKEFPADEAIFLRSVELYDKIPSGYPLAISEEEHFDAYFQLQPHPQKVPESAYLSAIADDQTRSHLKKHFEIWISKFWLLSGLRRLSKDEKTFGSLQKSQMFLALADCSDLMGASDGLGGFEQSELRSGLEFMEELISGSTETERASALEELFRSVDAVTARLLFLESLRLRCDPESFQGRKPRIELPVLSSERLDELRAELAAAAAREIRERAYLDHTQQGFRLWRWVHAVGIEHTETFLRDCLQKGEGDTVLTVLRCIARSEAGRFAMSFEVADSYQDSTSKGLYETLLRFAPSGLWLDFVTAIEDRFPPSEEPANGDGCLVQHVRRAVKYEA